MVYKLIFFLFIFTTDISYSNILYDKNGITITEFEIENYLNIYENNKQIRLTKNKAVKNIVLMKQTINFLLENNSEFMSILDKNIEAEFGGKIINDQNLFNFIRFQKIRNEFISEYFQNNFTIQDLEMIFLNLNNLKVPISKNKCLTIEKLHAVNSDKNFLINFYNSLKSRKKNLKYWLIINLIMFVLIKNYLMKLRI